MEDYKKKNWFSRNWKWVVPVGGCLTLIFIVIAFFGTIFFGVTKMFTSSEPYQIALEKVSTNEEVIAVLGEPIEKDGMINGSINLNGNDGDANFRLPIKGPKGEGRVVVVANKNYGKWTYEQLYVQFEDSENVVNLLDKVMEGE